MGTQGLLFCLAVCLLLGSIYSRDVLENMKDLKDKTGFGKYFPRQGLLLLCWLLQQGKIDQNDKLRLNINPAENTHPYGFHQYKNYEGTFPDLSNKNFEYYSLGNLFLPQAKRLPDYIVRNIRGVGYTDNNIDRIVLRVLKNNPTVVDEVYITEHFADKNLGSGYNELLTFKISIELLKAIAKLCHPDEDNNDDKDHEDYSDNERFQRIQKAIPNQPEVQRFSYLVGYDTVNKHAQNNNPAKNSKTANIKLELVSTPNGHARIVWDAIPVDKLIRGMKIGIFQNDDKDNSLVEYALNGRMYGQIDTDLPLTPGLKLRLLKPVTVFESVYQSSESDESEREGVHPEETVEKPYMFSNLVSIVLYPFRMLFSLVYFLISSLFYLVFLIVSNLLLLIYLIVSSLFSLIFVILSNVFSLLFFIIENVVFLFSQLITRSFSILLELLSLLLGIFFLEVIRRVIVNLMRDRSRAAPPFVSVSHGRPGY